MAFLIRIGQFLNCKSLILNLFFSVNKSIHIKLEQNIQLPFYNFHKLIDILILNVGVHKNCLNNLCIKLFKLKFKNKVMKSLLIKEKSQR